MTPKKPTTDPAVEPKVAAISMLPLSVRNAVDKLARQEKVTRSEIGRRAILAYVERETSR
jgi:predicted transcriptional regulator